MKSDIEKGKNIMKCEWEKDVHGFYITPLFGVSKIEDVWAIWLGWLFWLATWQITRHSSGRQTND